MVHSLIYCNQFSCHFWWDVDSDSDTWTHVLRRVFPMKALREFLEETQQWRISPIVWHIPSLLCSFAPRRWPSSPSSDSLMSSWVSNSAELRSRLLTVIILAPESTTNSLSSESFVDAAGSTHSSGGKVQPCLFLWACIFFNKIPSLASGTALLSFSLFMGPVVKFHGVGTSLVRNLDIYFSKRWSFLVSGNSRDVAWTQWIVPFELVPGLSASVSPTLSFLEKRVHLRLVIHNPIVIRFSQEPQRLCLHCLFFLGRSFPSAFYLVVHQPGSEGTNTCLLTYNPFSFWFHKIGTPADANIHKAFACKYPTNNIYTVAEEWIHGYFCLGCFSSSTHFYLVKGLARKVWRQCVLFFAHDLGFRGENCNGLLANTGLFLSTCNRYLFLLQHQWFPFDSLPRLLIQFSHAWRQSFVIEVSDLYSSLPWFF